MPKAMEGSFLLGQRKKPRQLTGLQTSWGRLASEGEPERADVRWRVCVRTELSRYGNSLLIRPVLPKGPAVSAMGH
jgi:hypothetical protein